MKMLIDNEWNDAISKKTFVSTNPATGEVLDSVPLGDREDTKKAIDSAERAFKSWTTVPAAERAEYLFRATALMKEREAELSELMTKEQGKPLIESKGEIGEGINVSQYIAAEGRRMLSWSVPSMLRKRLCLVVRLPLGVTAGITPWNYPFCLACWKIAPALVAGNTMVLKVSSITPLIGLKLGEVFKDAGLPKGVLNVITGPGSTAGDEILSDPRVKVISLTGEVATGKQIASKSGQQLKRVGLELGGKNPLIVLEDGRIDLAVEAGLLAGFTNCGQVCTSTSRIILQETIADGFVKRFVERTQELRIGNGLEPGVEMGPMVSKEQLDKVLGYIELGKKEAKLLCGGHRLTGGAYDRGNFITPTIFDHVKPNARIAQEEIFGPVVSMIRVKNLDEAIEVANSVAYGLSSAIYTQDINKAMEAIFRLEAGLTHINHATAGSEISLPFGGVKESGIGRELGPTSIEEFTELKTVTIDFSGVKPPWWYPYEGGTGYSG
jgi:acyl-CoA reductase-like NAD-dependent aldehyde dehydrogenase